MAYCFASGGLWYNQPLITLPDSEAGQPLLHYDIESVTDEGEKDSMPEIQIPSFIITGLQLLLAFSGAFFIAFWLSLIVWTFRDARSRSRDIFAILLATLMVVIFGPLGVLLYFLLRPPVTLAELYERSLEEEALLQDLEERPRCPGCSRQVKEAWIICPDCHTTIRNTCENCQNSLHLAWNICPYCGEQVANAVPVTNHNQYKQPLGQAVVATQQMQYAPPPSTPVPQPVESVSLYAESNNEQPTDDEKSPSDEYEVVTEEEEAVAEDLGSSVRDGYLGSTPPVPVEVSHSAPTIGQHPVSVPSPSRLARESEPPPPPIPTPPTTGPSPKDKTRPYTPE